MQQRASAKQTARSGNSGIRTVAVAPERSQPLKELVTARVIQKHCDVHKVHTDTDLLHGDINDAPAERNSNLTACCELCSTRAGCVGLTLTPEGVCLLKSSISLPTKQRGLTVAMRVEPRIHNPHTAATVRESISSVTENDARERLRAHELQQEGGVMLQKVENGRPWKKQPRRRRQPHIEGNNGTAAKPVVSIGAGCSSDSSIGCMARPAVVVMSHDRPEMTRRCLGLLLTLPLVERFTVYVSEDAHSQPVRMAAREFAEHVQEVISITPHVGSTAFTRGGVYKIAQHFRGAAEAVLVERGHSHAIFVEDDLLLAPDFLKLFWEAAWLLRADPTLWCISAWNDQGFRHTAQDPSRLFRTDYFPGLGWMIPATVWHELRDKWPNAPTTGWDHWMRLASTTRGRDCIAPEINRSRHASKRGTNVIDNSIFERFTFAARGVTSFGDLAYLLQERHEPSAAAIVRSAKRLPWPSVWGGLTHFEAAVSWMDGLRPATPLLLLYQREEYKTIARALGLWGENQRATLSGVITLRTVGGGTLLLADRRKCPYLAASEQLHPPASLRLVAAPAGISCDAACAAAGGLCDAPSLEWANSCAVMARHFPCEAGCGHQVGTELPAYATAPDLDTHQQCLVSDIAVPVCSAAFRKTARLCSCVNLT